MSTKEYGCFFCDGKSTDPKDHCPKCSRPIDISEELRKLQINDYKPIGILGRGFYGWSLKAEDYYQPFAIKIIPTHRLKKDSLDNNEARALAACSPHRNIARFWRQITIPVEILGQTITVLCLVFDFVDNAKPLSKIVVDNNFKPTRGDVVDILSGIASGLARMHSRGLWHDDFHDDNILVRTVSPDENLPGRYESKLIDFGSAKEIRIGEPESLDRSDYLYLSKHIFNLSAKFELSNQETFNPVDRSFVSLLRRLATRLSDRNISRRNLEPSEVVVQIQNALEETLAGYDFPPFKEMLVQSKISLSEPLVNTNAINLAPQDIALLFIDPLGWIDRIEKSEPVIVVGPRGCGKTMLLRYLSISSQVWPRSGETSRENVAKRLEAENHIGFLLSLGLLRTPFLRSSYKKLEIADEALAEDFCREFINSQFTYEILRTLNWLQTENLGNIDKEDLKPLIFLIYNLMGIDKQKIRNGASLDNIIGIIEHRTMELSNLSDPLSYKPTNLCGDDTLFRLAKAIISIPWAKTKDVWFLLDDYSPTVLPQLTIRSYNPVLFRLSSEVKIKMSSEGDGPIFEDTLGRKYKEGRELTKVNLGEVYFQNDEKTCREFFEQILEQRFKETGKASLEKLKEMLGEHEYDNNFGRYIYEKKRPGDSRFYGFCLICRLCSGDVSYIIELLNEITKTRWGQSKRILIKEQDEITKRFAQRQLADLRSTAQYGPRLYQFAESLGNLLKQYLLDSKDKNRADERLRIEIEGKWELSDPAQEMHDQLLRHSVLIPGGAGKSKKGLPTRKLYFRRLFAPCFPFSPNRRGCVRLTWQEYEGWLLDPNKIWRKPPENLSLLKGLLP